MRQTYPIGDQAREQESKRQTGGHNRQNSGRQRRWLDRQSRSAIDDLFGSEWKWARIFATELMGKWEKVCRLVGEVR